MSLRGHIVWTQGISAHDVTKAPKPRPFLILGNGNAYGMQSDTIVGLPCTTKSQIGLSPANTTLLCGLTRELAERLDLKQMFVNLGGLIILPYPSTYVQAVDDDPAQTVVIRERLVANYKRAADAVFRMPPHETVRAPVFAEICRPVPTGSIVNYNASLTPSLRPDPKAWIRRVIVLGKGRDFGLHPEALVCCPYERNKKDHSVRPLLARAFAAPPTSLHFPDAAIPVSKITEKALRKALDAIPKIDTAALAQYASEIKEARRRPASKQYRRSGFGDRSIAKGLHA